MSNPTPTAIVPPPDGPQSPVPPAWHRSSSWAKLVTGLAVAAAEAVADYLHPGLAEALAIADVAIPVILLLILFAVVVLGSHQTCDRVFRLLRWITNRPEPTAPDSHQPQSPGE